MFQGQIDDPFRDEEPYYGSALHRVKSAMSSDFTFFIQKLTITTQHKVLPKTARCQATLAVQHLQYDTTASVIGTIENTDCAASSGAYTIAVNIRDENGELQTLEFDESWQRSDDQPIEFSSDYPIGENVAIFSVRALRLSCVCADTAGE